MLLQPHIGWTASVSNVDLTAPTGNTVYPWCPQSHIILDQPKETGVFAWQEANWLDDVPGQHHANAVEDFYSLLLFPLWSSLPFWNIGLISQFLDHFTDCRTPWTGDQLIARPLPKHRTTQTQKNAHTHTKHLWPEWDSDPRSRLPSEWRQYMP
jgi:hypothetical protein